MGKKMTADNALRNKDCALIPAHSFNPRTGMPSSGPFDALMLFMIASGWPAKKKEAWGIMDGNDALSGTAVFLPFRSNCSVNQEPARINFDCIDTRVQLTRLRFLTTVCMGLYVSQLVISGQKQLTATVTAELWSEVSLAPELLLPVAEPGETHYIEVHR